MELESKLLTVATDLEYKGLGAVIQHLNGDLAVETALPLAYSPRMWISGMSMVLL